LSFVPPCGLIFRPGGSDVALSVAGTVDITLEKHQSSRDSRGLVLLAKPCLVRFLRRIPRGKTFPAPVPACLGRPRSEDAGLGGMGGLGVGCMERLRIGTNEGGRLFTAASRSGISCKKRILSLKFDQESFDWPRFRRPFASSILFPSSAGVGHGATSAKPPLPSNANFPSSASFQPQIENYQYGPQSLRLEMTKLPGTLDSNLADHGTHADRLTTELRGSVAWRP